MLTLYNDILQYIIYTCFARKLGARLHLGDVTEKAVSKRFVVVDQ